MGLLRELCNFRRDYDRNLEIKEAIPSLYKKDPSFYDGMRLQELAQASISSSLNTICRT